MSVRVRLGQLIMGFVITAASVIVFGGQIFSQSVTPAESPYVKCWEFPIESALAFPAFPVNNLVYIPEANGIVRAVDAETGLIAWTAELGGSIASNLASRSDRLFVISNPSGGQEISERKSVLWVIDIGSGLTIGSKQLPYSETFYLVNTEPRLISVNYEGQIAAFDEAGVNIWSRSLDSKVAATHRAIGDRLVVATGNKAVTVIDTKTGSDVWTRQWKSRITAVDIMPDDMVTFGDDRGNVVQLENAGQSIGWKFKAGGSVSQIAKIGDEVAVASLDNFLYLLTADNGKVKWRKRLASRAVYPPLVIDERIVAAGYGENSIPISELRGGKTVNRIDLERSNYFTQIPQATVTGSIVVTVPGFVIAYSNKSCVSR